MFDKKPQCVMGKESLILVAIERGGSLDLTRSHRLVRQRKTEFAEANRMSGGSAIGARNASCRNTDGFRTGMGFQELAGPSQSHRTSDFPGNSAVLSQQGFRNVQEFCFRGVLVAHDAAPEDI